MGRTERTCCGSVLVAGTGTRQKDAEIGGSCSRAIGGERGQATSPRLEKAESRLSHLAEQRRGCTAPAAPRLWPSTRVESQQWRW